jgi:aryl-alcohol dehydrogenase-like predicted oxidoreductase
MSFDPAAKRRIGHRDVDVSLLGVGTAPFGSTARGDSDASISVAFSRLYDSGLR